MVIDEGENSEDREEDIVNEGICYGTPVRYPLIGFLLHVPGLQHGVGGQLDEDLKDKPGGPGKLRVLHDSPQDI